MTPRLRIFLLVGCVGVAAVASPLCARVVREDLQGHYARPGPATEGWLGGALAFAEDTDARGGDAQGATGRRP